MDDTEAILDNLIQELKRGTLVLTVLLCTAEPVYGYALVGRLQERGIDVDQNTLYPLLRRLEKQGLLASDWGHERCPATALLQDQRRRAHNSRPAARRMEVDECGDQRHGKDEGERTMKTKLIEQYLYAIGRKLSYRGRNDIKAELESLILDDIEAKYGANPTEMEVKERIKAFGSPTAVARRYRDERPVIAVGLSDMYFFLLKILAGALAIAYFVIFVLSLFQGTQSAGMILASFGKSVAGFATGYLCAIGAVSLAFIAVTRAKTDSKIDLDAEWDPDDLKDIEIDEPHPSKANSIVTLVCLAAMAVVMNAFPWILTFAETIYAKTGLPLGHRLSLPALRPYIVALTVIWAAEAVYHIVLFVKGRFDIKTRIAKGALIVASLVIQFALVFDLRLYETYTGIIGFRLIFIIGRGGRRCQLRLVDNKRNRRTIGRFREMNKKENGSFVWRVTYAHVIAYFIAGLFAVTFLGYREAYATATLSVLMRQVNEPIVALGPALQILRGLIIALVPSAAERLVHRREKRHAETCASRVRPFGPVDDRPHARIVRRAHLYRAAAQVSASGIAGNGHLRDSFLRYHRIFEPV